MLVLSTSLFNRPILSLRLGGQIGVAKYPIINPHNLSILGWWSSQSGVSGQHVLLTTEVRESSPLGLVVDDANALSDDSELHRHQAVFQLKFYLINKLVKSPSKKLGKITDYAVDEAFLVQKLYVEQSLVRALTSDTLLISRSQITEVTDRYILVDDGTISDKKKSLSEKFGVAPQSA